MLAKEFPGAFETEGFRSVFQTERGFCITFAIKNEDRVRSAFHTAFDHARKMNAYERKFWIRNRIDEVLHLASSFLSQIIIITAESNDRRLTFLSFFFRNPIGL